MAEGTFVCWCGATAFTSEQALAHTDESGHNEWRVDR